MKSHTKLIGLVIAIAVIALVLVGAGCQKTTTEEATETVATEEGWSSATDKGDIPDTPITGTVNGKNITVKDVQIQKMDGEYDWSFSNLAPDSTCGVVISNDAVNFSSKVLQEGTFEKKMTEEIEFDDYHSYYHYNQEDDTPMTINTEGAAKVVVKKIDEASKKVTGWARFNFDDDKTMIEGSFTADLCE